MYILFVIMWMSTETNTLQGGHQNQTKALRQIIKELPDYNNMTVFEKDTIHPSKCVRPNNTTKILQELSSENNPDGTVLLSVTETDRRLKRGNYQIQRNKSFMAKAVRSTRKESFFKSKDMVSNEFYNVDEFDYAKNDEGNLYQDFDDFDEINGDVVFKDFGSNLMSEMFTDQENFNYYEYVDKVFQQMNNRVSAAAGGPNGINAKTEYFEDMEYADFGTLFRDEEQTDYDEYLETLKYFKLLDKLTKRNGTAEQAANWHSQ